jgi:hypothetical protein
MNSSYLSRIPSVYRVLDPPPPLSTSSSTEVLLRCSRMLSSVGGLLLGSSTDNDMAWLSQYILTSFCWCGNITVQVLIPCSLVLMTSRGCRIRTDARPAVHPATPCFLHPLMLETILGLSEAGFVETLVFDLRESRRRLLAFLSFKRTSCLQLLYQSTS